MRYISDEDYKKIMKKMVPIDKIQIFSSEQECLEHEKVLNEEKIKREKLIAEKNKRKDEVVAAYDEFTTLLKKYTDDYNEPIDLNDFPYPLNSLFTKGIWRLL
ncbi:hypothetical protein [Lacrimispora indolis]|uniref:hypothetical protein n=1 Tax=Lacrimispora indolis TaxID=69825 RepID=UPI00042584FF|nr:hypothetical protein [[Clostridium] methoxybenzovorans]